MMHRTFSRKTRLFTQPAKKINDCSLACATPGVLWKLVKDMRPKKTILCVDDNEQALSIRKVMLETRGYRVLTCTNGQQALDIFKRGGVDLLLSDLLMPGLDGADLVRKVKEISPETPAILFSGKIKVYDRDTKADIFLPKGMYAPVELLERIRILLIKKRGPKRAAPRVAADIRIAV